MKKIRVKTIFGGHQIYQEIVNFPPKEVEYLGVSSQTTGGEYYQNKKWKEKINEVMQLFHFPRMIFVRNQNCDIVHSSRGIIPITNRPWVMDIEQFTSFVGLHFDIMVKNKILRKFIENRLASKNCKKILCHCNATKQSFLKYLNCEKFEEKLEVIYPSSHIIPIKKTKSKKIRFLFVSSLFEQKGGEFVLEAFKRLCEKYEGIELLVRSDVEDKFKKKYGSQNIIFEDYSGKNILGREEFLQNVFSRGDVFIYTTFCDSFGYSLIDALVAKMPIIGTNLFATPEIVRDKENGFIIDIPGYDRDEWIQEYHINRLKPLEKEKFILDLMKSMEKFINSPLLIREMGEKGFKRISTGDLSLENRNKKIKNVYIEALQ